MTTLTLEGDPRFDVRTVHETNDGESPMSFLARCIKEHTAELIRKTEILQEKGLAAVENKDLPN